MPKNLNGPEVVKHQIPQAFINDIQDDTPVLCQEKVKRNNLFTHCDFLINAVIVKGSVEGKPIIEYVYSSENITTCASCPIGRNLNKTVS